MNILPKGTWIGACPGLGDFCGRSTPGGTPPSLPSSGLLKGGPWSYPLCARALARPFPLVCVPFCK